MGSGRFRLLNNALGSIAILGVLAVVTIGLPAWDRSLPAARPLTAGEAFQVGAGVSVVPPTGALLDLTRTRPGATRGSALFLIGPVRYAMVAEPFIGSLTDATHRLRNKITNTRGYQVTGGDGALRTDTGIKGRQGGYASSGRDGWYAVYLADGVSVEVTVSGTQPGLRERMPAIERSMASIQITGRS